LSVLVVGAWLLALTALGWVVLDLVGGDGDCRVLAPVAGLVLLHLFLVGLDLSPLSWSRLSVVVPFFVLAAVAAWHSWGGRAIPRRLRSRLAGLSFPQAIGWGDAVAAACVVVLGGLTLLRRIAASDFIYHWGIKGEKFALAGGIDRSFLAAPWNGYLHPDYPNLVPELFAATALTQGGFPEAAVLLWSVVATGLLLLTARSLLAAALPDRRDVQAGLAILALGTTSFTISWQMTGNADAWLALAVLISVGALQSSPGARMELADLAVGIGAALAASVKTEGVVFAGLAVVVHLGRRLARGRPRTAVLLRTVLPAAAVVVPWAATVWTNQLAQSYTRWGFDGRRLLELPPIVLDSLLHDGWHGLSLVAAVVVVSLPFFRRVRLAALVLLGQLAFYVAVYLTTTGDMEFLIRTTAPRLLFHLLPAALVLAFLLLPDGAQPAVRATERA